MIATHHLDPMEPEEVEPYILHRLKKVGWTGNPSFAPEAFELIFDYSDGVPRKLNVLVSRLLLFGAVEELHRISAQHVRNVIAEVESDRGIDEASLAPLPVEDVVAHAAAVSTPEWPAPVQGDRPPFAAPPAEPVAAEPANEDRLALVPPQPAVDEAQIDALKEQIASLEARPDVDAAIAKAEKAGATVVMPASDQFWGARFGMVRDPFGHLWAFNAD